MLTSRHVSRAVPAAPPRRGPRPRRASRASRPNARSAGAGFASSCSASISLPTWTFSAPPTWAAPPASSPSRPMPPSWTPSSPRSIASRQKTPAQGRPGSGAHGPGRAGRLWPGELHPLSDLDLMVIFDGEMGPYVQRATQGLLYTLWDLGLQIGHAVRSLPDCVAMARTDFASRTSMQQARYLVGDRRLFNRFRKVLAENVYRKDFAQFLETTHGRAGPALPKVRRLALHGRAQREGVGGRAPGHPHRHVAGVHQVRHAHAARAHRQAAHHRPRAGVGRRRADLPVAGAQRAALPVRPQERRALARCPARRSPGTSATLGDEMSSRSRSSCATTTSTRV
mgnify:CR=1 FL=1